MHVIHVTTFEKMSVLLTQYKEDVYGGDGPCDVLIDEESIIIDDVRQVINRLVKSALDPDWCSDDHELSNELASCLLSFVYELVDWTDTTSVTLDKIDYIIPLSLNSGDTMVILKL